MSIYIEKLWNQLSRKDLIMKVTHRRDSSWPCCRGGGLMPPTQCPAQAEPAATAAQLLHTLVPSPPRHTKQMFCYQQVQTQMLSKLICFGTPKLVPFWTLQIPQTPWRSRQRAWGRPGTNWRRGKLGSTSLIERKVHFPNISFSLTNIY